MTFIHDDPAAKLQRREHARMLLSLPASLLSLDGTVSAATRIMDLSRAGAGIVHGLALQPREHYVLRIQLPRHVNSCDIKGEIVYCAPVDNTNQYRCGVRFLELSAEVEADLSDFLTSPPA